MQNTNAEPSSHSPARQRFHEQLDQAVAKGKPIQFWWRDDDAIEPTVELDRLIHLAHTWHVPIFLAVIPQKAGVELAHRLADEAHVYVLQHGFMHRNHANKAAGERASEFGESRSFDLSINDLSAGHRRMSYLFKNRYLPIFVPPWNRASEHVIQQRQDIGLIGFSAFGQLQSNMDPNRLDAHVDPIKWKPTPHFVGIDKAWERLVEATDIRLNGDKTPIGFLTHHLGHSDALWAFIDDFLHVTTTHAGAQWPVCKTLFPFIASPSKNEHYF